MRTVRLTIAALTAVLALLFAPAALAAAPVVQSLSGTEGTPIPAGTAIASFTDGIDLLVGGCPAASSYSASIDWGDGTPAALGAVSLTGATIGQPCQYAVATTAAKTYAEAGSYTINVNVSGGGNPGSATGSATIADAPLSPGTAIALSATQDVAFSGVVAGFTDANTSGTAGDFSATIDWGDGTTSPGTISGTGTAGRYTVSGAHTWAQEGSFPTKVKVTDQAGSTVTVDGSAAVADAPLSAGAATTITATSDAPFSGTVGTFTDADSAAPPTDFSGTIDWGDGTSSAATIATTGTPGQFSVTGSHTYPTSGSFPIRVAISDVGGSSVTVTGTANVTAPPLTPGAAVALGAAEGAAFSGTVASFSDANPAGSAGDFTATVDWGDGSTSPGSISQTSAGRYSVSATHTWTQAGSYPVAVAISDADGAELTIDATAAVADAALTAGAPSTITATSGTAFNGLLGTFTDANPAASARDFTGTITWGDGSRTAATIAGTSTAGRFTVSGQHTYSSGGTFAISIAIDDAGGSTATLTGTANVSTPPPPPPPALTTLKVFSPTGTAGQQIDTLLAVFSDADSGTTPSSYSAKITWGDGTTADGTIVAGGVHGVFGVIGIHTYAAAGTYTITVVLQAPLGRTLTITTTAHVAAAKPSPGKGKPPPKSLRIRISRARVVAGRGLAVRISCPRSASSCRGFVSASSGRSKLGTTLLILPGGRSGTFDFHLRARLRRRHASLTVAVIAADPRSGLAGRASRRVTA